MIRKVMEEKANYSIKREEQVFLREVIECKGGGRVVSSADCTPGEESTL